jgi:hypothetical protein
MITNRTQRPGVTLTEVLVALFVMAIGMIALLTLFPLGAMQLSQAIKDDRTAQASNNADYLMRMFWRKYVVEATKNGLPEVELVRPFVGAPGTPNPNYIHFMTAMENPNITLDGDFQSPQPPVVLPNRQQYMSALSESSTPTSSWATFPEEISSPSYPVVVDPYGELTRRSVAFTASRRWVAGVHANALGGVYPIQANDGNRIPRRTLNFPPFLPNNYENPPYAPVGPNWQYRYATLQDDVEFGEDGLANNANGISRTGRYTWSWVLQRPTQGNRLTTNMTVIVYDQRAYKFARNDEETAYTVEVNPALNAALVGFVPGATTVSFRYDTAANLPAPLIRAGQWIMDGTITPWDRASGQPRPQPPMRNANFYRVTAVTDSNPGGTTGIITLDLQTPIKSPPGFLPTPAVPGYAGQLYLLFGVSEVFERRPLTTDDTPDVP